MIKEKYSKTFAIGEYCKGGVISVEVDGNSLEIIGREWDFSKGSSKNSDQSQAKVFTREKFDMTDADLYQKVYEFLTDLTTHYYAEQVMAYCGVRYHAW